jgi:hypothetical protein
MLRRIARVVNNVKDGAYVAREISAGLYEAVASVLRVQSDLEAIVGEHEAQIQAQLPGF